MANEKSSYVAENGITLGIALLALFVIFGVGLPRWLADDAEAAHADGSNQPIELPATLSGGFELDDSDQATQMTEPQMKGAEESIGSPVAIGQYRKGENGLLIVQAVRAPGKAALPPTAASYSKVDDATCMTYQGTSSFSACNRSDEGLTVQVTAVSTDDAAKYAGEVFDELSGS